MDKKRFAITGIFVVMVLTTLACYLPEITSSDNDIATKVAESVNSALQETQAAQPQPTYTPYPTYTPMPTYTPAPTATPHFYTYTFERNKPPSPPQGYNIPKPPMPRR